MEGDHTLRPFKGEEAYSGWRVYTLRPFKGEEAYCGWRVYTLRPFKGEEAYSRWRVTIPLDLSKGRRHIAGGGCIPLDHSNGRRHLDRWRVPYPFKGEEAYLGLYPKVVHIHVHIYVRLSFKMKYTNFTAHSYFYLFVSYTLGQLIHNSFSMLAQTELVLARTVKTALALGPLTLAFP